MSSLTALFSPDGPARAASRAGEGSPAVARASALRPRSAMAEFRAVSGDYRQHIRDMCARPARARPAPRAPRAHAARGNPPPPPPPSLLVLSGHAASLTPY